MPYQIVRNDITQMRVDVIVNPTDPLYSGSGGTDAQIHRAAGERLRRACDRLPRLEQGQTAVTKGYRLPCRYVIHTVGPVWHDGTQGEKETLYACYHNALEAAVHHRCKTVAFPLIASGTFGFPKDRVLRIALEAIGDYLMTHDMMVYIVVYDKEAYAISQKLHAEVQSYIDEHYIDFSARKTEQNAPRRSEQLNVNSLPLWDRADYQTTSALWAEQDELEQAAESGSNEAFSDTITFDAPSAEQIEARAKEKNEQLSKPWGDGAQSPAPSASQPMYSQAKKPSPSASPIGAAQKEPQKGSGSDLERMLSELDEGFSGTLLRLIDERGMTDVQCYKKANIDKKLFSKIRSNPHYQPSKPTVLAFAVALELSLSDTKMLLERAGLALSHSSRFDVVVEYFLNARQYDLMEINEVLYQYDLPCLGNVTA